MEGRRKEKRITILMALGIVLVLGACMMIGGRQIRSRQTAGASQQVMSRMAVMIPQYAGDDPAAKGAGEDPLPVIEIDGTDFVGYLELPALIGGQKMNIPVASEQYTGSQFAFVQSGSPVRGGFVIGGKDLKGIFAAVDKTVPGDTISFVDVNGIRYDYKVTGLGNTEEIDADEHDLILCRGVSRKVYYAVYGALE